MFSTLGLELVRSWAEEWRHTPSLQLRFPSLSTFLVYRASESPVFQRHPHKSHLPPRHADFSSYG